MTIYRSTLALILGSILISCSDSPTGDPSEFWYRYNTAIVLEAGRTTMQASSGSGFQSEYAGATFHNPDSLGLFAGDVRLEGASLMLHDTTFYRNGNSYAGESYYLHSSPATNVPLRMAGSLNTFTVSGGPHAAGFTLSVPSPLRELVATAPTYAQKVAYDTGFTVRWEPSAADSSLISLNVFSVSPDASPQSQFFEPTIADDGSYVVTPQSLINFPPGPVGVTLRRYRRSVGRLADQRQYDAQIYSEVKMVAILD